MPINSSDSPSLMESKEAAGPGPEQNHAARSPYAPKRERLTHGGPPVHLGKPLVIDVPRFLIAPYSIDDAEQSQPNRSPCRTVVLNSSGVTERSGGGRQARAQRAPPHCVSTLMFLKRASNGSNARARSPIGSVLTPLSRSTVTKRRRTRDSAPGSAARSNQRICPQR